MDIDMINLVLEAFSNVVDIVKNADSKRIQRLENAWSEANSNTRPNIDRQGRFHAPCDGYQIPITNEDYIGNYDEMIFAKGQYLPIPLTGDDGLDHSRYTKSARYAEKYLPREKIKVDAVLADQIINELKDNCYIGLHKGKCWAVNDIDVCYLYLESANQSFLNQFYKAIKSTIENNDVQIYNGDAVVGRARVKGKVLNVKVVEGYSYNGGINFTRKLLIRLDNDSTCFGTEPSTLEIESGDEVEFTATFEKSDKQHHSFYKRPHNMIVVSK